jgi:hypothetical protein
MAPSTWPRPSSGVTMTCAPAEFVHPAPVGGIGGSSNQLRSTACSSCCACPCPARCGPSCSQASRSAFPSRCFQLALRVGSRCAACSRTSEPARPVEWITHHSARRDTARRDRARTVVSKSSDVATRMLLASARKEARRSAAWSSLRSEFSRSRPAASRARPTRAGAGPRRSVPDRVPGHTTKPSGSSGWITSSTRITAAVPPPPVLALVGARLSRQAQDLAAPGAPPARVRTHRTGGPGCRRPGSP